MSRRADPYEYNITTRRVSVDGEVLFEARVKELPDVCEYGDTMEEAYELAIDTIETAIEMFAESGRPFPTPAVPQEQFSGRVTLRLSRSLHRAMVRSAEDEGVSLNQHLVNILAGHPQSRAG